MWQLGEVVLLSNGNGVMSLPFLLRLCGGSGGDGHVNGRGCLVLHALSLWPYSPLRCPIPAAALSAPTAPREWISLHQKSRSLGKAISPSRNISLINPSVLPCKCCVQVQKGDWHHLNGNLVLGQHEGAFVAAEILVPPEDKCLHHILPAPEEVNSNGRCRKTHTTLAPFEVILPL